jgi:hypothetical protein
MPTRYVYVVVKWTAFYTTNTLPCPLGISQRFTMKWTAETSIYVKQRYMYVVLQWEKLNFDAADTVSAIPNKVDGYNASHSMIS